MKKISVFSILVICFFIVSNIIAYDIPTTGRIWNYNILTAGVSKNLSIMTIPGIRYEFLKYMNSKRVDGNNLKIYEFYIGPSFHTHLGKIQITIPLLYHYMGFTDVPKRADYSDNHNIDLFSVFTYSNNRSLFHLRIFFHNTFYSTLYKYIPNVQKSKSGYSLLFKLRFRYSYWITKRVALSAGDEVLYGLIEDSDFPAKTGPGFTEEGVDANRILVGAIFKIAKNIKVMPYYFYMKLPMQIIKELQKKD